ncbi:putative zinc finger in N-recognin-domain-containing protein [Daldinia sp. FL1419]|nr:putative zinc finger in N-recognin-domain-containing protein [Daldinia sp. FL1419]
MDSSSAPATSQEISETSDNNGNSSRARTQSLSQQSDDSQTAADFIRDQLQLEADAREALPYSIENCTKPLGPLRQNVFACLTCNPPPANPSDPHNPAGVCYSCSVQCHGDHELVEIFQKRNFTCDCGTSRFTPDQKCTLRINPETNTKGGVHSEEPDPNNKYNHNFRNRFCSCSIDYDPDKQVGTMYQCLGLGTQETGGCGEDWYHPGCLVGLGPNWYEKQEKQKAHAPKSNTNSINGNNTLPTISEDAAQENGTGQQTNDNQEAQEEDDDPALPEGFPAEDAFDHFICYKCVGAYPWIKRYAGAPGFLPAVFFQKSSDASSKKRGPEDDDAEEDGRRSKRVKSASEETQDTPPTTKVDESSLQEKGGDEKKEEPSTTECKLASLPPVPSGQFSLFAASDFRDQFCRCASCFPDLKAHPQLLEEEEAYEPPLSDGASEQGSTHGSGSLYDRGESALKNVDRVRAIEGVMAYNHLKERLKPFFQQFAESGKAIGAEDIKEYFAKLRGDEQAIKEAGEAAKEDHRQEQSGY